MTSLIARLAASLIALATALMLASCTSPASDGHTDHEHSDQPVISGQPAGYNADDVAFATNMIPHHEQAVELSALVPDRSTNPELQALAEQISKAQEPEIRTMQVLLVQWQENPDADTGQGGHEGHGGAMQGMVDDATMAKLQTLSGPEFDTLWLQSMIAHHQGAIEMARAELANGENVDAKRLAQTIVHTQQAEIDQMNQMLRG
ncbi:DUF305 domain-containing protein [Mycobacterium sp. GA-1199]|uniref:DUF305 domain-containing protein n=1 Tax=Mycobacterium sp. GA-1199 TaxID=1772287 RepID=UPI0007467F79|nr:DUF305 domain-containing protein [Mycobacterium sp. GA-1199]KUI44688.1 DUF305 domain-containing protein [Mycobacterium sp. GA-1199]